jgi:hypothetical protein
VQHIIDAFTEASGHLLPSIDRSDVHLVLGSEIFQNVPPRLTLRQVNIDSKRLLFGMITDEPPALVSSD